MLPFKPLENRCNFPATTYVQYPLNALNHHPTEKLGFLICPLQQSQPVKIKSVCFSAVRKKLHLFNIHPSSPSSFSIFSSACNPPIPICAVHIFIDVWPFTGAGLTYQESHTPLKKIYSPSPKSCQLSVASQLRMWTCKTLHLQAVMEEYLWGGGGLKAYLPCSWSFFLAVWFRDSVSFHSLTIAHSWPFLP